MADGEERVSQIDVIIVDPSVFEARYQPQQVVSRLMMGGIYSDTEFYLSNSILTQLGILEENTDYTKLKSKLNN